MCLPSCKLRCKRISSLPLPPRPPRHGCFLLRAPTKACGAAVGHAKNLFSLVCFFLWWSKEEEESYFKGLHGAGGKTFA